MGPPDAKRRPAGNRTALKQSAATDTEMVPRRRFTVDDFTVVPDHPVPGAPLDDSDRLWIAYLLGTHVVRLIDAGELEARVGSDGSYYFRARDVAPTEQTSTCIAMLNGTCEAAA